ncbi:uncharacterized protein METZ01_LOCUS483316, partial [marine metagenome]
LVWNLHNIYFRHSHPVYGFLESISNARNVL